MSTRWALALGAAALLPRLAVAQPATDGRRAPAPRGMAIDERLAEDAGLAVGSRVRLGSEPGAPTDSAVVTAILARR
ncbi:MAG: hypothetical protein KJT01_13545, partial [Gemmatimonadetes bacterium]|nr:hypothetical protein [Gemmatimonadota bacterium]